MKIPIFTGNVFIVIFTCLCITSLRNEVMFLLKRMGEHPSFFYAISSKASCLIFKLILDRY